MEKPVEIGKMIRDLSAQANGYREAILLLTANRSGLFTKLTGKPLPVMPIAEMMGWDVRAAEAYLNALTAMGLLTKTDDLYSNSEVAERLLVEGRKYYQGDILNHNLHLWERWSRVEEVLGTGKPLRDPKKKRTDEELQAFIRGMANIAELSAVNLWNKINLSGHRRLLDVGGGPGTYALEACRRYPDLSAVVVDLPEVKPIFEEYREKSPVGDRVTFAEADVHSDPLPGDCDAVLLSNVIHSWSEDQNQALLKKIELVIPSGGLLIIKDFFISGEGTKPLFAALFSVNMLLGTQAGRCYTRSEVENWLSRTEFKPIGFFELTEQAGVLQAVRK